MGLVKAKIQCCTKDKKVFEFQVTYIINIALVCMQL